MNRLKHINIRGLAAKAFFFSVVLLTQLSVAADTSSANDAALEWLADPTVWSFFESGKRIESTAGDQEIAECRSLPVGRTVTVEATVEAVGVVDPDDWKVAGVAIVRDSKNLWHLAIAESPVMSESDKPPRRFIELAEMRDGQWLAQHNLRCTINKDAGPWKPGEAYNLQIKLTPEGIEGVACDRSGRIVRHIRYQFNAAAVTTGRPALRSGGFHSRFTKLSMSVADPVEVTAHPIPPYKCDSFVAEIEGKGTGYFHVEQIDGTWWTIDPQGRGFVLLGADHIRYTGHWCEKLGYNPYERKNNAKYADQEEWAVETLDRLRSWGFNFLSGGASPMLYRRGMPHVEFLSIGSKLAYREDEWNITPGEGRPCTAFPNVFHPQFEASVEYQAKLRCEPQANDPWLLGYFLDNELAWWGRGRAETGLFDAAMKKSARHSAKRVLVDILRKRYDDDIDALNRAWGIDLASFDTILTLNRLDGNARDAAGADVIQADKQAFLEAAAERYFGVLARAIRRADPNHMILGCRFAGGHAAEPVWQSAGRYCDVMSINYYGNVDLRHGIARDHYCPYTGRPLREAFDHFYKQGRRPLLITEWSFPAIDSGLPCTKGAGQRFRTQAERARASEIFARAMLRMPQTLGYSYFMWVDEPALGISTPFPENTNYGLVSEDGVSYRELAKAFTRVHADAPSLRRSASTPSRDPADYLPDERPADISPLPIDENVTKDSTIDFEKESWTDLAPLPSLPQSLPKFAFNKFADGSIRFSNDRFTFDAKKVAGGWHGLDVQLGDVLLGRLSVMVHQQNGASQWIDAPLITRIEPKEVSAGLTAVDLTARFDSPDPDGPRRSFEIDFCLVIPQGDDRFACEISEVRSRSDKPIVVRAVYLRLNSEIAGDKKNDTSYSRIRVPRLWLDTPGDAWIDPPAEAFWGVAHSRESSVRTNFWIGDWNDQHSDCRLEKEITLAPAESWKVAKQFRVVVFAGRGETKDCAAAFDRALEKRSQIP